MKSSKLVVPMVVFALVGCSGAAQDPGPNEHDDKKQQEHASGSDDEVPISVTSGGDDPVGPTPPASGDGGTEPAAPAAPSCTSGTTACGKPDHSDSDNVYTCANGGWTKSATCSFGCSTSGGAATCKPNPLAACCAVVKARQTNNDNLCFAPPGTAECPMTATGGYCDPNGDKSYTDGDWVRGYYDFRKYCK